MNEKQRYKTSTYRQKEMETIARWIEAGDSGAVIGLAGVGKSNLLRFLGRHPENLQQYLAPQSRVVIPIPLDINDLPAADLATVYRSILRAFYERKTVFPEALQPVIEDLFQENKHQQDPFLPQTALRQIFSRLDEARIRVVLVMDRFGYFCRIAPPRLFNTLRGLRDNSKKSLSYLVGLRQEIGDIPDADNLDELFELLDGNTCWVGAFSREDGERMIEEETDISAMRTSAQQINQILELTGGYPALLKSVCRWWRATPNKPNLREWSLALRDYRSVQNRLQELWDDLTQEEQLVLSELEEERRKPARKTSRALDAQHRSLLEQLAVKGLCYKQGSQWRINGELLSNFVFQVKERGRGRLWLDQETGQFWQGSSRLELRPQLYDALFYFYQHPRERLPKTELMTELWAEDWREGGDGRLYVLIRELRQQIEPNPYRPVYLTHWSGKPEGGYQFFPEGRAREDKV